MSRFHTSFTAHFHASEAVLHLVSVRGVRRIQARSMRAERLRLDRNPPAWEPYCPRLRFDRLFRLVNAAADREFSLIDGHCQEPDDSLQRISADEQRSLKTARAVNRFIRAAGEDFCRTAARFTAGNEQHLFVRYLQLVPGLMRLRSNAPLLFALFTAAKTLGDDRDVVSFLQEADREPSRQIARRLGFPNARMLGRVSPDRLDASLLAKLRRLCTASASRRTLSHLERITPDVIRLMADPDIAPQLDNRFLMEMGMPSRFDDKDPPSAEEVVTLLTFLNQYRDTPIRIRSVRHFWRLLNRCPAMELLREGNLASLLSTRLPPPPIPEEQGYATALRTPRELIAESVQMQNCVAGLYGKVLQREAYYYRIERSWGFPRATMEIVRDDDCWRIAQVVCPRNTPFPRPYLRNLAVWLADKQGIEDEVMCLPD